MPMVDVRHPPVVAVTDREMEIIALALGLRVADLMNLEQVCQSAGNKREQRRYAAQLSELHALRDKLGVTGEDEE